MRHIVNASRAVSRNIFPMLLALTPAVFAAMLVLSDSVVAATAMAVAYASVILGETIE